jgi:hypothetical protein
MELTTLKELCQQPTLLNVLPSDVVSLLHPLLNCEFVTIKCDEDGYLVESGYMLFGKRCGKWKMISNGNLFRTSIHYIDHPEVLIDWISSTNGNVELRKRRLMTDSINSVVSISYDEHTGNPSQIWGWCQITETPTNKWLYKMTQGKIKFLDVYFVDRETFIG